MTGRHAARPAGDDRIRFRPKALCETRPRDWVIRFGFGAGVSVLAGVVTALWGPRLGGVFLAFPAILLASLTLVAKEAGIRQARNDARGATYGTLGLIVFALVLVVTAGLWPLWLTFVAATTAWAVVALGTYLLARLAGAGGDEPAADRARARGVDVGSTGTPDRGQHRRA
ncbi:DUF3147 family protein [Allokutzneria oryzae]|uniref:DUF3147 family protein n=1 Tax=Allokutzneria oryzae TaxID=1378989 RepID=A0ABV6A793_9PSEU